jgi:hypothetical protein
MSTDPRGTRETQELNRLAIIALHVIPACTFGCLSVLGKQLEEFWTVTCAQLTARIATTSSSPAWWRACNGQPPYRHGEPFPLLKVRLFFRPRGVVSPAQNTPSSSRVGKRVGHGWQHRAFGAQYCVRHAYHGGGAPHLHHPGLDWIGLDWMRLS